MGQQRQGNQYKLTYNERCKKGKPADVIKRAIVIAPLRGNGLYYKKTWRNLSNQKCQPKLLHELKLII